VFEVQDEIAAAVAEALRVRLVKSPSPKHHPKLPAYEAFLKGRHQIDKLTPDGYETGRKYLEEAIALDPDCADPHVILGEYYYYVAMGGLRPPKEAMPLARASATRALELEPSNPGAHAVLCYVAGFYEYDWQEAEKQRRLATAVPAPAWARAIAAVPLLPFGRFDEAVREMEAALALDPLNVVPRVLLSWTLNAAGFYEQATVVAQKGIEIDEHQNAYHGLVASAYIEQGRFAEALAPAERAFQLAPWSALAIGPLAGVLVRLGERERAEQVVGKMPETEARGWVTYHRICLNVDAALDWFEKMIELRNPSAPWMARAKPFESLRQSSRWPKLARMMNLPEVV